MIEIGKQLEITEIIILPSNNRAKLVEAGYIDKQKEKIENKFLTAYSITPEGLKDFDKYKSMLVNHIN